MLGTQLYLPKCCLQVLLWRFILRSQVIQNDNIISSSLTTDEHNDYLLKVIKEVVINMADNLRLFLAAKSKNHFLWKRNDTG